jgi:hypothetical protein
MSAAGASLGAGVLVVALCACNPITLRALEIGHPEEPLCAAFAIGAVLAGANDRAVLSGILLGLAIGTKAWAVLAIGPVLLALPRRRLLALAIAGTVTSLIMLPLMFAGSAAQIAQGASHTGVLFNPWQVWWPLGHVVDVGYTGLAKPGARFAPDWLSPLSHPLIAVLMVPLSLAWWWRRRRAAALGGEQVLALLALLLLARCILDPWNTVYYQLPFLLALLAWEALCLGRRPPVLTLFATVATWVTFETLKQQDPDLLCAVFLIWTLPLAGWLGYACFGPALGARSPQVSPQARPTLTGSHDQHQPIEKRQPHRGRRDDLQGARVPARQARQGWRVRAHEAAPDVRRKRDRQDLPRR